MKASKFVSEFAIRRGKHAMLRRIGNAFALLVAGALSACGPDDKSAETTSPSSTPSAQTSSASVQPTPTQADLAGAFQASTNTIFEAKTVADFGKFKPLNQVTLSVESTGLRITATGTDPGILLPPFAEGKPCVVQVVIEAPLETPFQVFYSLRGHEGFTESQSYLAPLVKGTNTIYFQLNQPTLIDPVRLDPGASPGEYVISSVVAKALPKQ